MKQFFITLLGLLTASVALGGQELGLPDNSDHKPAPAAAAQDLLKNLGKYKTK